MKDLYIKGLLDELTTILPQYDAEDQKMLKAWVKAVAVRRRVAGSAESQPVGEQKPGGSKNFFAEIREGGDHPKKTFSHKDHPDHVVHYETAKYTASGKPVMMGSLIHRKKDAKTGDVSYHDMGHPHLPTAAPEGSPEHTERKKLATEHFKEAHKTFNVGEHFEALDFHVHEGMKARAKASMGWGSPVEGEGRGKKEIVIGPHGAKESFGTNFEKQPTDPNAVAARKHLWHAEQHAGAIKDIHKRLGTSVVGDEVHPHVAAARDAVRGLAHVMGRRKTEGSKTREEIGPKVRNPDELTVRRVEHPMPGEWSSYESDKEPPHMKQRVEGIETPMSYREHAGSPSAGLEQVAHRIGRTEVGAHGQQHAKYDPSRVIPRETPEETKAAQEKWKVGLDWHADTPMDAPKKAGVAEPYERKVKVVEGGKKQMKIIPGMRRPKKEGAGGGTKAPSKKAPKQPKFGIAEHSTEMTGESGKRAQKLFEESMVPMSSLEAEHDEGTHHLQRESKRVMGSPADYGRTHEGEDAPKPEARSTDELMAEEVSDEPKRGRGADPESTYGSSEYSKKISNPSHLWQNLKSFKGVLKDKLNKAMTAGYGYAGAPGAMSGGSVLMTEDLDKKPKYIKGEVCPVCKGITPHVNGVCSRCALFGKAWTDSEIDALKKEHAKLALKSFVLQSLKEGHKDGNTIISIFEEKMLPDIRKGTAKDFSVEVGRTPSGKPIKMLSAYKRIKEGKSDQVSLDEEIDTRNFSFSKQHKGFTDEDHVHAANFHVDHAVRHHETGTPEAGRLRDMHMHHALEHIVMATGDVTGDAPAKKHDPMTARMLGDTHKRFNAHFSSWYLKPGDRK